MKATPEVSQTVLKSGLDVAVRMLQAGRPPGEAIDAAVQHIRSRESLSMLDEARARDWLTSELPNAVRAASADSNPEEKSEADAVLYQKVGPDQFSPVGNPTCCGWDSRAPKKMAAPGAGAASGLIKLAT